MRRHVDQIYNAIPPHMRPPTEASAAKANKVFSTPELLETIMLSGLDTRDKLQAMRVQRSWRNTVNGSRKLRRSLGLALFDDYFYYSPFHKLPRCDSEDQHLDQSNAIHCHLPGGAKFYELYPAADDFAVSPRDPGCGPLWT
jgi:hypothetical protein